MITHSTTAAPPDTPNRRVTEVAWTPLRHLYLDRVRRGQIRYSTRFERFTSPVEQAAQTALAELGGVGWVVLGPEWRETCPASLSRDGLDALTRWNRERREAAAQVGGVL